MSTHAKANTAAKFKTGQRSPIKGTFICEECEKAGRMHTADIGEGQEMPECNHTRVTWRLVSYDPAG
jgi:hypothetical protein